MYTQIIIELTQKFLRPSPLAPLPFWGEGKKIDLTPLLPFWEKGLGDEGNLGGSKPSNIDSDTCVYTVASTGGVRHRRGVV